MTHIHTKHSAPRSRDAWFPASERRLPPVWREGPTSIDRPRTALRATMSVRARIAAVTIALVALVALASVAPASLLVLLMVVVVGSTVIGGLILTVERRTRPWDATARRPSYFSADRLTRREA